MPRKPDLLHRIASEIDTERAYREFLAASDALTAERLDYAIMRGWLQHGRTPRSWPRVIADALGPEPITTSTYAP